jgi:hypothetical protein
MAKELPLRMQVVLDSMDLSIKWNPEAEQYKVQSLAPTIMQLNIYVD